MVGKIIIFSGYAGTGKNTIINALQDRDKELVYIPSVTTRKKRKGEREGHPYYYVTEEFFNKKVKEGKFIEYENIHGSYYGTLKDKYLKELKKGKIIIKDIDVKGALNFKKEFGDKVVTIFVKPLEDEEVIKRMYERGDTEKDIEKRKERISFEKGFINKFDYVLINDILRDTIKEGEELVDSIKKNRRT